MASYGAFYGQGVNWDPNAGGQSQWQNAGPGQETQKHESVFTPLIQDEKDEDLGFFVPGKRRRINFVGLFASAFVGPILFVMILTILSSEYRFHHPRRALLSCVPGAVSVWVSWVAFERNRVTDREPKWLGFVFFSMVFAFLSAAVAGNLNYESYMLPYYDSLSLNEYPDVNVAETTADSYLDAGFIGFSDGSILATGLPMNITAMYRYGTTYCVAAIINTNVNGGVPLTGTYDFWAVGKDCCDEPAGTFMCGEFKNPAARSGFRETNLKDRPYYLNAVAQAEAKYGISSQYPIFVHWTQDPVEYSMEFKRQGQELYMLSIVSYLFVNALLVCVGFIGFSRIGSSQ